jgi:hypothetical protein
VIAKRIGSDCNAIAKRLQSGFEVIAKRIAKRLQSGFEAIAKGIESDCKAILKRI